MRPLWWDALSTTNTFSKRGIFGMESAFFPGNKPRKAGVGFATEKISNYVAHS